MIKVLVVDDSGFMRLAIKKMLEGYKNIQVIAEAVTGNEAVRLAKMHRPDVITMDVEMPDMDGLQATRQIMEESPTPIIMVSSLTKFAADVTVQALQCGAVDYISKSSSFVSLDIAEIEADLIKKILYWSENFKRVKPVKPAIKEKTFKSVRAVASSRRVPLQIKPDLILIGASTGGPRMLPELLKQVEVPTCPIVIALHMPALYTKSFAEHLKSASGLNVVEGFNDMVFENDMVVVLPGGTDSHVVKAGTRTYGLSVVKDSVYTIHPSVNALFLSALKATKRLAGVVMTGMGDDGLEGAIEMHRFGLPVLAQNDESCIVYGMPRAIVEAGVSSGSHSVESIADNINDWFSMSSGPGLAASV
jgi:two-component system chemotaxis response regulator CheB